MKKIILAVATVVLMASVASCTCCNKKCECKDGAKVECCDSCKAACDSCKACCDSCKCQK